MLKFGPLFLFWYTEEEVSAQMEILSLNKFKLSIVNKKINTIYS